MALGKYNRRTVSATSGAVLPGATVSFYNQLTGLPATAYNDPDGLDPIGSSMTSGSQGEVEVFLDPGKYRITVELDDLYEEITYEPVTGDIAVVDAGEVAVNFLAVATPAANSIPRILPNGFTELRTVAETKTDLSLNNVDNTSDVGKPVSTATQTALNLKEDKSVSENNKIVIFGSSVALGTGATAGNSYVELLETSLAGMFSIVNLSVGGDSSQDLIDRFYTDMVPEKPAIVFIGLSLLNEGLTTTDPDTVVNIYITNIKKLIRLCQNEGYKVVIGGVYPNNAFDASEYAALKMCDYALSTLGVPYIGFLGALDNGTGGWRTGCFSDADHPNDVGHSIMYSCIDPSIFNNLIIDSVNPVNAQYALQFGTSTAGINPLVVTLNNPARCLSVTAWVKRTTGAAGQPILVLIGTGGGSAIDLRVANQTDEYALRYDVSNLVTSAVASSDGEWHHLAVTFVRLSGSSVCKLYIDGVLIGTDTAANVASDCQSVYWGSRDSDLGAWDANGYEYAGFSVWRTVLTDAQIKMSFHGGLPLSSLSLYSAISVPDVESGNRVPNFARSDIYLKVAGGPTEIEML
jgi:hypothetical protein